MFYGCCTGQLMPFSQTRWRKGKEHFQYYKGNIKIKKQTNQSTTELGSGIHKCLQKVYATNRIPRWQSSAVHIHKSILLSHKWLVPNKTLHFFSYALQIFLNAKRHINIPQECHAFTLAKGWGQGKQGWMVANSPKPARPECAEPQSNNPPDRNTQHCCQGAAWVPRGCSDPLTAPACRDPWH